MKKIYIISITFLLFNCSTAINDNNKKFELGVALTSRQIHVIKDLKEMVLGFTGKSRMTAIPFSFAEILNIDSTNITLLPYYDFDTAIFYEDPSPEKILESLTVSDDLYFAISKDGCLAYSLLAKKKEDSWVLSRFSENWGEVIKWFPEKLQDADSRDFKIFRAGGIEYFLYYKNGKTIYSTNIGQEISEEILCETILESIHRVDENKKYLDSIGVHF
ncbi:MAG TPA: hypothetical protein H9796_02610 [Candidatus Butyricimonas faecavium]|nr:hypothetical protein [Candidatus Butyricimonas faecavium]